VSTGQPYGPLDRAIWGGGNLQTLRGTILRRRPSVAVRRETWETPDGDVIDLDVLPRRDGPGVIVLHGLEGSSRASYVLGMLGEFERRGWNAVALNFRSCGPSPQRWARTYHSGFTSDLAFAVERLTQDAVAPLGLVGFSLGGNVVVKYMGERGMETAVAAAVGISVPFDLAASVRAIDAGGLWPALYRGAFLAGLKRKALAWTRRFPGALDVGRIRKIRTLGEFDEYVTAPLFGFASAADYWEQSSSARFVERVRKPTMLLSAADDPMIPFSTIPIRAIRENPALTPILAPRGGHAGFVGGSLLAPRFVAEQVAAHFLASHLDPQHRGHSQRVTST
jgi:predicted alpha/beta-fold hydrolase